MGGAMRIIAGSARGRKLIAPAGEKTRPTSDKLRGALFNILAARVAGAHVLDLFGGTGALALEAISRGAAHAVIVDVDRRAIAGIRQNAKTVLGEDFASRIEIIQSDFKRAIDGFHGRAFDMVFLDPPYAMDGAYQMAIERLDARGAIHEDSIFVCEREKGVAPIVARGFSIYDARVYGDSAVDILRRER
jgi:16S rRNA (guanine966-N2)-methyltransferase